MILRFLIFLLLNFGALWIGSQFTAAGVSSEWYTTLAKAPWTPPGWVFGAAWTIIMICLAVYMAKLWPKTVDSKLLLALYGVQLILNTSWNPVFFYLQHALGGLVIITSLSLLVALIAYRYAKTMKASSLLIAPYLIWLLIATSLNAYIVINN